MKTHPKAQDRYNVVSFANLTRINPELMIKIIVIAAGLAVIIFFFYRNYATNRATQLRNKMVLDLLWPIALQLQNGEPPDMTKINELADDPLTRGELYMLLDEKGKLELFPEKHKDIRSSSESQLIFWLMHPNELGARPSELELAEIITRKQELIDYKFFVYKFKWNINKEDRKETWVVGVVGPFDETNDPYKSGTAFSTFGDYERQSADKHVDWFIENVLAMAK